MTKRACEFVQPLTFRALSGNHVLVDDYATDNPDPIAHITFSQSVDLFLVAPATANIIAKMANGIADDFLTSTYLASTAPVLIAPAMNTRMWQHPATQRNVQLLKEAGVHVLLPDEGEMACGTIGPGRLSEPERIVEAALEILNGKDNQARDLAGENILITAGATQEEVDPVRFISNRSSGKMGFALAKAAHSRGATVTLVSGVTSIDPPADVMVQRVRTADEMYEAVIANFPNSTVFIGAAAVADYKPNHREQNKIKKTESSLTLELERTRDILGTVAKSKMDNQLIIGFAAETQNMVQNARAKMESKGLDAIVANDVSRSDSGFDSDANEIMILLHDQPGDTKYPLMSKIDAAHKILDQVVRLRASRLERENKTAAASVQRDSNSSS
jgi:phosphopantothenoylcysteine decarboxylase/phosphopantothenate--cysteine ligase